MKKYLTPLLAAGLMTVQANAAFTLFEDFDSDADWTDAESILSVVTDPIDGGSNSVGRIDGDAAGEFAKKAIGSTLTSGTVTFFYRVAVNDTNTEANTAASTFVTSATNGDGFSNAATVATIKDGIDFTTYDNGETTFASGLSNLTWYNVWVVADLDNAPNENVDVYISATDAASGSSYLDADFRQNVSNIDSIELVRGGRFGDPVFYDDIYIDTVGANLTNPIPEPASLILLAAGGLMMAGGRRRSDAS
jgi:hypothetical protein